jgi:hypothetical protein
MVAGHPKYIIAICLCAIIIAAFAFDTARTGNKDVSSDLIVDKVPRLDSMTPAVTVPKQCICTMEYDPVCGRTRDGNAATYSNPCQARCAGATVITRGRC